MDMSSHHSSGRRSPRKRRINTKLQGFYLTEKGQTVRMSALEDTATSMSEGDGDHLKITATTVNSEPEDDDDHNKENGLQVCPNTDDYDWLMGPSGEDLDDDLTDLYTGIPRATINILAEVHSFSPPGYVSSKETQDPTISDVPSCPTTPNTSLSSPSSNNGCVVKREDRITIHKRGGQGGSPTRKSRRIRRGTEVVAKQQTSSGAADVADQTTSGAPDVAEQTTSSTPDVTNRTTSSATDVAVGSSVGHPAISEALPRKSVIADDILNVPIEGANERKDNYTGIKNVRDSMIIQNTLDDDNQFEGDDDVNEGSGEILNINELDELEKSFVDSVIMAISGTPRCGEDGDDGVITEIGCQPDAHGESEHLTNLDAAAMDGLNAANGKGSDVAGDDLNTTDVLETLMEASVDDHDGQDAVSHGMTDAAMETGDNRCTDDIVEVGGQVDAPVGVEGQGDATVEVKGQGDALVGVKSQVHASVGVNSSRHEYNEAIVDTTLNTSTEEFVSADEMPQDVSLECCSDKATSVDDPLRCTPPMATAKAGSHLEVMRKSLPNDCSIKHVKTPPTPPRINPDVDIKKESQRNGNDPEELYHSAAGDDDDGRKESDTVQTKRRRSRQRTRRTPSNPFPDGDSDDDATEFPMTQKKSFTSQFQKFLLLTKDLDDTPPDKVAPIARDMCSDSPATSLAKQLTSFTLHTPVAVRGNDSPATCLAHQLTSFTLDTPVARVKIEQQNEETVSAEVRTKHSKKCRTIKRSPSPPPLKRRCLQDSKIHHETSDAGLAVRSKRKAVKSGVKTEDGSYAVVHNTALKDAGESHKHDVEKPNLMKTPPRNCPPPTSATMSPVVNLAQMSDKSAIQEYLSPAKLRVNISTPAKEIEKHCSPSRLYINMSTPISDLQKHCSPLRVSMTMPIKDLQKHCSPVRVNLGSPNKTMAEYCSVSIPEASNSSSLVLQEVGGNSVKVLGNRISGVANEVVDLGDQVSLDSTRKSRPSGKSGSSRPGRGRAGNADLDTFAGLDEFVQPSEPARRRGGRKASDRRTARRTSTRLLEKHRSDDVVSIASSWDTESLWDAESVMSTKSNDVCYDVDKDKAYNGDSLKHQLARLPGNNAKMSDFDAESTSSVATWQTGGSIFLDDFEPFPVVPTKRSKTSTKRRSLRIAKRQSFQLGNFEDVIACQELDIASEMSSEKELRAEGTSKIRASRAKEQIEDMSDVESIVSTADSDIIFCGKFSSPTPNTTIKASKVNSSIRPRTAREKAKTERKKKVKSLTEKSDPLEKVKALKENSKTGRKNKVKPLTEKSDPVEKVKTLKENSKTGRNKKDKPSTEKSDPKATVVKSKENEKAKALTNNSKTDQKTTKAVSTISIEEQKLWDDFDVGYCTAQNTSKPKTKAPSRKAAPSRRISSRLHRDIMSPLLELTNTGEVKEVLPDVVECEIEGLTTGCDEDTVGVFPAGLASRQSVAPKKRQKRKKESAGKDAESGTCKDDVSDLVLSDKLLSRKMEESKTGPCHTDRDNDDVNERVTSLTSDDATHVGDHNDCAAENEDAELVITNTITNRSSDAGSASPVMKDTSDSGAKVCNKNNSDASSSFPDATDCTVDSAVKSATSTPSKVNKRDKRRKQIFKQKTKSPFSSSSPRFLNHFCSALRKNKRRASSPMSAKKSYQADEDEHQRAQESVTVQSDTCLDLVEIASGEQTSGGDQMKYAADSHAGKDESKTVSSRLSSNASEENTGGECLIGNDAGQIIDHEQVQRDNLGDIEQILAVFSDSVRPSAAKRKDKKKAKKTRNRRRSSQCFKPVRMVEAEQESGINDFVSQIESSTQVQSVNMDDVVVEPKQGGAEELLARMEPTSTTDPPAVNSKRKNVKKCRRRSSCTFKPVHLMDDDTANVSPNCDTAQSGEIEASDVVDVSNRTKAVTSSVMMESERLDNAVYDKKSETEDPNCVSHRMERNYDDDGDILQSMFDDDLESTNQETGKSHITDKQFEIPQSADECILAQISSSSGIAQSERSDHLEKDDDESEVADDVECTDVRREEVARTTILEEMDYTAGNDTGVITDDSVKGMENTVSTTLMPDVTDSSEPDERKSSRLASRTKMNYSEIDDKFDIIETVSDDKSSDQQQGRRSQRRKSSCKVQKDETEEDKKLTKRRKGKKVITDEEVEEIYTSQGKSIHPCKDPTDLLETIFESPVKRYTGTPIFLSKRKYHRTQKFPEKPWHARPGKLKATPRKKRGGGAGNRRKKAGNNKTVVNDDEDVITAHLDEVLANISDESPESPVVDRLNKKVPTPFPRQSQSRVVPSP